jgi:hypothetical protein
LSQKLPTFMWYMKLHHICHKSYLPLCGTWSFIIFVTKVTLPWVTDHATHHDKNNVKEKLLGSCHDLCMVYVQTVSVPQTARALHDRMRVKKGRKWLWSSSRYYPAFQETQAGRWFYIINLTWHYECYLRSWFFFRVWRNMRCAATTSFTGWLFLFGYMPCRSTRQAQTVS